MKYRDYVTDNLWGYIKVVFNWDKFCCILCHRDVATKKILHQPADKPGVCQRCWDKMNKRKTRGSGARARIRELIDKKRRRNGI